MIPKSMILTTFPGDVLPGSSSTNLFEWSVTIDCMVPALSSVKWKNLAGRPESGGTLLFSAV